MGNNFTSQTTKTFQPKSKTSKGIIKKEGKNPGKMDHFTSEANSIINVRTFGGLSIFVNQVLNRSFNITHQLKMGSTIEPPNYTLSTSYSSGNYLLQGNIDQMGTVRGAYFHKLLPRLLMNTNFRISKVNSYDTNFVSSSFEYFGQNSTTEVELSTDHHFVLSHLRTVLPGYSCGVEVKKKIGDQNTQSNAIVALPRSLKVVGKIKKNRDVLSVILSKGPNFFCTQYVKKVTPRIGLASEFLYSSNGQKNHELLSSFAVKYAMRNSKFQTRLTSNGEIYSLLNLKNSSNTYQFSTRINYPKDLYSIGFGMRINANL
ncbi:import receptor subunit tom40 [Anaeramoeba flamelloides]|uniref:Import receptor subunit tom40 n=1 Tax=Anaeramoeba flamelloides TaxID=1746091 RepID=A0AAV7YM89_9EUKA|nr:import receptor subunit tom40 [Anaeramoeba flamelloides]